MRITPLSFLLASLLLVSFVLAPAPSALASEPESITLDAITIRGTKSRSTYLTTPESVSVLDDRELPGTGRENNLEVLNAVPNVEVNKGGESFSIRGINNTGVTGYQKDNLSSLVIDGLFQTDLATQSGSFDLWDMERIEVLKGAQSATQGVNSLAGTILLDHRKAEWGPGGSVKTGLGTRWHRESGIAVNGVLVPNTLAYRLSYGSERNEGFITNLKTGKSDWGGWSRDRLRAVLKYKLTEKDEFDLQLKFQRNDQGGTYTQGSDAFKHEVDEDVDARTTTRNAQSILGYSRVFSSSFRNDLVLGFSRSLQDSLSDADGTPAPTAGARIEAHDDRFLSVENRVSYDSGPWKLMAGIHAHSFRLDDSYDFNLLYPVSAGVVTPLALEQGVERTRKTYAFFTSNRFEISERHALLAGLRLERTDSMYGTDVLARRTENLGGANATVDAYLSQVSGSYSGKNASGVVLPKLGYSFSTDSDAWTLSYTRGYRTAGVSINRRRATAVEYDPEFTDNYELSYKRSTGALQLGANAFYTDWKRQQVQVRLSNDFFDTQVANAARSEVYGGEFEARIRFEANQTLGLGVGYSHTEFKDFVVQGIDYSGNSFPFAANWTGRIAHETALTERLSVLNVLRFLSRSYSNAENDRSSPSQWYWNLNGRYAVSNWIIEGYVNNVLNRRYRIFDGTPTSSTSPYQASYHQVNTPREAGLRAVYVW